MKPICHPCRRFFRPKLNGFYFIEGMPLAPRVKPGLAEPEKWKPYKLWVGDLWKCHGCGTEIVVGFNSSPLAEHFQPDFEKKAERLGATYQVNDC